jgi:prevent-host-death family protein
MDTPEKPTPAAPTTIGAFEAKTHLSKLLDRAEAGETITITKHGRPVARLVPARGGVLPGHPRAAPRLPRSAEDVAAAMAQWRAHWARVDESGAGLSPEAAAALVREGRD